MHQRQLLSQVQVLLMYAPKMHVLGPLQFSWGYVTVVCSDTYNLSHKPSCSSLPSLEVCLEDSGLIRKDDKISGHHTQESCPEGTANQKNTHWTLNKWKINQTLELFIQWLMLIGLMDTSTDLLVLQETHHCSNTRTH